MIQTGYNRNISRNIICLAIIGFSSNFSIFRNCTIQFSTTFPGVRVLIPPVSWCSFPPWCIMYVSRYVSLCIIHSSALFRSAPYHMIQSWYTKPLVSPMYHHLDTWLGGCRFRVRCVSSMYQSSGGIMKHVLIITWYTIDTYMIHTWYTRDACPNTQIASYVGILWCV